jgi:hypothetical protein
VIQHRLLPLHNWLVAVRWSRRDVENFLCDKRDELFIYGVRVSAYGVRVSAYGISHQWLRRPRKRLRSGPDHTGHSARSAGPARPACAPREAMRSRPSTLRTSSTRSRKNTFSPSQEPDVTRNFSVCLALDDDADPIARREFLQNFLGPACYFGVNVILAVPLRPL